MPCGRGSVRNALWNLDYVTRRRAMKLNEQQEQRLQHLCKVLDRQKYYNGTKADRAMQEVMERGQELEQECRIRRLLVERNLANTETNRAIMERILRGEMFKPPLCSESYDDHVWISRMPRKADGLKHKGVASDTHNYKKQEIQSSSEKLQTMTDPVQVYEFEVILETGSIQRWHMPVHSLASRLTANIRSSHYTKVATKERARTTRI